MPLAPEFEATSRLIPTRSPFTDTAVADRASSPSRSCAISPARTQSRREVESTALDQHDGGCLPGTQDGCRGSTEEQLEDRWLLYLRAAYADDDWHLYRVDLHAPADPPMDLTPLPPGSRVITVDPLVRMPGAVLVSMDERPGHVEYFLIHVETGQTTADLPLGGRRN